MKNVFFLLCGFLVFQSRDIKAQADSLSLDIKQAEALFLKQNYDLIASNYQIDQAQAEVINARLFENPELQYENLLYNHETHKLFQTSYAYGQYAGSISQLFKLAGKRNKNIRLAQLGTRLAEYAYFDLMRSLKFELYQAFYQIYFSKQSIGLYEEQIAATDQLLQSYLLQQKAGDVALKDVIRIKALLLGLKATHAEILNDLEDQQKEIRLLCGLPAAVTVLPLVPAEQFTEPIAIPGYALLLETARSNRSDLNLAKIGLEYQQMNLRLQKAMAIPDIELSLSYDLKGNYPEKYTGLGIKIPLPLFNRNQGEIKKAAIGIKASETEITKQELLIENEVSNVYRTILRNEKMAKEIDPDLASRFDQLIIALFKNFRERNISLIEFLDLFEAYKENSLQIHKLQQNRFTSRAELNFVTGTNLFK